MMEVDFFDVQSMQEVTTDATCGKQLLGPQKRKKTTYTQVTPKKIKSKGTITTTHNIAKSTQTHPKTSERSVSAKPDTCSMSTQISLAPLSIELIQHSYKEMRKHTGIDSFKLFSILHTYLTAPCDDPECHLDCHKKDPKTTFPFMPQTENQLLLTLFKLRCNHPEQQIAKQMHTSVGSVSQIFNFWIKLMYRKFKIMNISSPLQQLQPTMPQEVRETFPNCREIFDATEIYTQKPTDPITQKLLWSNYKHHHTVKVQIGCSASGVVSSISDTYGGGTCDKQLFQKSAVVNHLSPGDGIMVDKGYLINDLLQGTGIELMRPPFLPSGTQFSAEERDEGQKSVTRDGRLHPTGE